MSNKQDRIQYLTGKAQRGAISINERNELAKLLGRNPKEFETDDGLNTLVGIGLLAIAIAIITNLVSKDK
jgi:hypothetical protein